MRVPRLLAMVLLSIALALPQQAQAVGPVGADLAVTMSENRSPEPVVAGFVYGQSLTYSITLRNDGPAGALGVTLSDSLPAHTTLVSFSQTSGPAFTLASPPAGGRGAATATTATLDAGASASFALTLAVDANTAEGTALVNTATVSSSSFDPTPVNDSATTTTRVTTYAGLGITISGSPKPVLRGHELTYALMVQNNGPSDAQAVELSDPIPSGTTFVSLAQDSGPAFILSGPVTSSAGGAATATIGTLAVGERGTFTLVVRVDPDTPDGKWISNTVSVNSSTRCAYSPTVRCGPLATGERAITRSATDVNRVSAFEADLAVSMSDSPDPVQAGADLSYAISVVNNGPDTATNVGLRGHIPVGTTLVSFVQDSGPAFTLYDPAAVGGRLAAGEAAAFTLVVRVDPNATAGKVIDNTAEIMWSDTSDGQPGNDGAGTTTTVVVGSPAG
jgi:uncharacterized repeat protein (TIGR01451 family)